MINGISKVAPQVRSNLLEEERQLQENENQSWLEEQQQTQQVEERNRVSSTRATRGDTFTNDPQTAGGSFQLSVNHIYKLMQRFRMGQFTYQDLQSMEISQLSSEEKGFVRYLQRNPEHFTRFASLNRNPNSISIEDIRAMSRLSRDSMVLTSSDLENLSGGFPDARVNRDLVEVRQDENAAISQAAADARTAARMTPPSVSELETLLRRISEQAETQALDDRQRREAQAAQGTPPPPTYNELMGLRPERLALSPEEQVRLAFLQSPAVSGLLNTISLDNNPNQFITVDVLRIMSSLINNPMIDAAVLPTFFRPTIENRLSPDEPIDAAESTEGVRSDSGQPLQPVIQERYRVKASDIFTICYRLSQDGKVTLEQLRGYQPENEEEGKTLNLLRQSNIFHRLAELDDNGMFLSEEDIQIAAEEESLVISENSMELIIQS